MQSTNENDRSRIIETLAEGGDVDFDTQWEAFGTDVWNVPRYVEERREQIANFEGRDELNGVWS